MTGAWTDSEANSATRTDSESETIAAPTSQVSEWGGASARTGAESVGERARLRLRRNRADLRRDQARRGDPG